MAVVVMTNHIRDGDQVRAPSFPCPCGGQLTLDDTPDRYFAFLRTR
jgi:hypothetical protein